MTNILLQSLNNYYNNGTNMDKFNDYVNGEKKISLRIIDWFVTNYSKKYNVFYEVYQNLEFDTTDTNILRDNKACYYSSILPALCTITPRQKYYLYGFKDRSDLIKDIGEPFGQIFF